MTWVIDSASMLSGAGVETDAQALYDRDVDLYEFGQTWWFNETIGVGVSDGAWTTAVSTYIWIPTFIIADDVLYVSLGVTGSPTNCSLRILDVTSSGTGTEVASGSSIQLDYTLGAWGNTAREFAIQFYKDSGGLIVQADNQLFNVQWGSGE